MERLTSSIPIMMKLGVALKIGPTHQLGTMNIKHQERLVTINILGQLLVIRMKVITALTLVVGILLS